MSDPQIIDPSKLIIVPKNVTAVYRGTGMTTITVIETVAGTKHIITNKDVMEVAAMLWPEHYA